jgi:TolB-like protein/DNA-binding winged helix-turn-helix (wHTH) protein
VREIIHFGVFELDLRAGELRKQGRKIALQEQPFQVLRALLERPGEVVTREKLRERIWPADTFVDFDHGLYNAVKRLREALGDSADAPRYIETLSKRGYRFIGSVDGLGLAPRETPPTPPARALTDRLLRPLMFGAIGAALLAAALVAFRSSGFRQRILPRATPPTIHSLAVLPLENLSGDPSQEYFADGMTDALTTDLAQIGSLKVISRTSSMQYKGTKKSLPEIAGELNVDGIVEGTVQRAGNRVRITAQLIHGPSDRHLWANSYERNLEDVLSLQGEIARAIAEGISVKLTPQEQAGFTRERPMNLKALEDYLQGRYHYEQAKSLHFHFGMGKTREAELNEAIGYLQQAVDEDPNYAAAYAEMGEVWATPEGWYTIPWREDKAREAIARALAIDPTLAEAHADLGRIELRNWHWAAAEQEFRRAIELNPNLSKAREFYSEYLDAVGRRDEGMRESERAQELDPSIDRMAWEFYVHRQFDRFIELKRVDIARHAFGPMAHFDLGFGYELAGKKKEAVEEWEEAMTEFGYTGLAADLRRGYAAGGFQGAMRAWAAGWEELTLRGEKVQPETPAYIYETIGDNDRALGWLEKAYQERSWTMPYLKIDPTWDRLRGDPRFAVLIRRTGLTP